MTEHRFDVVVVGSGTAATFVVQGLNRDGRRVAIVDERPYGGTCALRGCQSKKYLVSNAEAVAAGRQLLGQGIAAAPRADWAALQQLKNAFLEGHSEDAVEHWQRAGVATFHGHAVMTGPDALSVGDDLIRARLIVLATGAVPRSLKISGAEHVRDSSDFLDLPRLPERIIFIGGGYISFEFAHVAIRCGAKEVIIFNRSDQPLKRFDPDMVAILLEAGAAEGLSVRLEETPTAITAGETGLTVTTTAEARYETDLVVGAIGRVPNLSVLEGGKGGVESDQKGIRVNPCLQSISNPRVYAVGDCAATGWMLAPVADAEGKAVARNIAAGNVETIDYTAVPSVVFTIPSIASVGLGEAEAGEQGRDFRINQGTTTRWPSSRRIGETHGGYKVLIDNETDAIVGAHIVRHQAADAINILALAMKHGIRAGQLEGFMWAYPTLTSDLKYMVG